MSRPSRMIPLLNTPNLIVSPHSAAQTREAVIKMATMCVDGCLAVIRGEKWPFVADKRSTIIPSGLISKRAVGSRPA